MALLFPPSLFEPMLLPSSLFAPSCGMSCRASPFQFQNTQRRAAQALRNLRLTKTATALLLSTELPAGLLTRDDVK